MQAVNFGLTFKNIHLRFPRNDSILKSSFRGKSENGCFLILNRNPLVVTERIEAGRIC
ncbi:Uncharacterized protein dnm_005300 [Desulfonema magnum]|uniref:Uncharacterized protein n=1 Tax=Desulfonema magnum TaxID=45655 RepID=A0A975BFV0_9BACT|nr:Uncharacterized protein dnm_005300 [Desulfonema magnum]